MQWSNRARCRPASGTVGRQSDDGMVRGDDAPRLFVTGHVWFIWGDTDADIDRTIAAGREAAFTAMATLTAISNGKLQAFPMTTSDSLQNSASP